MHTSTGHCTHCTHCRELWFSQRRSPRTSTSFVTTCAGADDWDDVSDGATGRDPYGGFPDGGSTATDGSPPNGGQAGEVRHRPPCHALGKFLKRKLLDFFFYKPSALARAQTRHIYKISLYKQTKSSLYMHGVTTTITLTTYSIPILRINIHMENNAHPAYHKFERIKPQGLKQCPHDTQFFKISFHKSFLLV